MAAIDTADRPNGELLAIWPDGGCAEIEEVQRGDYAHRSNDFAIVRLSDHATLRALGLDELVEGPA